MSHQKTHGYKLRNVSSSFMDRWAVTDTRIDKEVGVLAWANEKRGWGIVGLGGEIFQKRSKAIELVLSNSRTPDLEN